MKLGVPKESTRNPGETRVALVPESAKTMIQKGHKVVVETGAGEQAFIPDAEYKAVGCEIVPDAKSAFQSVDCVLKVRPPANEELAMMSGGQALITYLWALRNRELVDKLKSAKITSFSMDAIPRISRAQSMDALSSMATIAGYKAVLLAATHLGKFMPMLTTAAGTIRPAQGLIIGAGVAGLQAIATARRLGAVVEAFDTRPAVKEQVQSLGAKFVEIPHEAHDAEDKGGYAKEQSAEFIQKEKALIAERVKLADFVITTALIPGKTAPVLVTKEMIAAMKPGSVLIDLAAETGGNCEGTKADQHVRVGAITILGPTNLPATVPLDASRMYSRNMTTFFNHIVNEKGFTMDWEDEIFRETCITHNGEIKHPRLKA